MRYEFRPLTWTDKETDPRLSSAVFRASWPDTLVLLGDELRHLEAQSPVIFQVAVTEGDIRLDGMLRANAKMNHPGVAVSFQSRFGPLRYATDAYDQRWAGTMPGWQANIRAVALALQALRAVDRYGVSKRGEQYTGWKALPAGNGQGFGSADEALRWMRAYAREQFQIEADQDQIQALYRALAKRLHPDRSTGNRVEWDKLDAARNLLVTAGLL